MYSMRNVKSDIRREKSLKANLMLYLARFSTIDNQLHIL